MEICLPWSRVLLTRNLPNDPAGDASRLHLRGTATHAELVGLAAKGASLNCVCHQ
jgi:hypothetical protein